MGVGSATDGNSGTGGVGGGGGIGNDSNDSSKSGGIGNDNSIGNNNSVSNDNSNNSNTSVDETNDKTNETSKATNQSVNTTHASRTGVSAAAARAAVETVDVANVAKAEAVKATEVKDAKKVDDRIHDGKLVGVNGKTYDPGTPLSEIDAVVPANGITNDRTVVHVNGIRTDLATQVESMQAIADRTGSRVVGVHNATAGTVRDLAQSLGDKLDIGNNPAVDTLADTIYNEIKAGRQVDLMAHSQGAIITSRALTDVRNQLQLEDGLTRQQAEALLGNVRAETFGGASRRFPDGPEYVHYVNREDFVPMAFGLRDFLNPFAHAGRGAVTHYFNDNTNAHGFDGTYLPERVPFDQARQGNFN